MKHIATSLVFSCLFACQPIGGADPLDSAGSSLPVIHTVPDDEIGSSIRGEIGLDASADF